MKAFIKKHVPFVVMSSLLLLMIILLIILQVLKQNTTIAENWTRSFTRSYTSAFGIFNQNLVFSITEASLIVSIISCVVFLAWSFCSFGNRQIWPGIHRLMMVVLVIMGAITMYSATAGMAYNRKPVPIEKYQGEIKPEEFEDIITYYIEDWNACANKLEFDEKGEIKMPYSNETFLNKLRDEFKRLPDNGYYGEYVPKAKPMSLSGIYGAFSIVGMYFAPLGEANYNTYSTTAEKPFYIVHELAHGTGVMREDDAQLVATYLCLTSEDPLLRYSCYFNTFGRIYDLTEYIEGKPYDKFAKLIDDKIRVNENYWSDHWRGKNFMYDLGDKINNWYLRTFGQKDGTKSYDDTPTETDQSGNVIGLSHYQSIYVKYYYDTMLAKGE